MFSIISVYHNKEILERNLLRSLKNQDTDYELILIDNVKGQFGSVAKTLNYGARQIKSQSQYIAFVHQDVVLKSNSWLGDAEKILDSLPKLGVAGVAGKSKNRKGVITNIKHGVPPKLAGEIQIRNPMRVQVLDECLAMVPRLIFDELQFDEKVCDDWHLYVVDYCLSIKKMGFDVYVIPLSLYHVSTGIPKKSYWQIVQSLGTLSGGYYQTLKKLLKKHKNFYKWIYTTCGNWSTLYPLILQRIWFLAKVGMGHLFKKFK